MRVLKSLSVALIATTMGLASLPDSSWATENAQQRQAGRNVKQDTRQGARQTKRIAALPTRKATQRAVRTSGIPKRRGARPSETSSMGRPRPPHRVRCKTTLPGGGLQPIQRMLIESRVCGSVHASEVHPSTNADPGLLPSLPNEGRVFTDTSSSTMKAHF